MNNRWIKSDHPIFDSPAFRRDGTLFNVLSRAINPTAFLRLSDGNSYVIARNRADLAAWAWTSDDVAEDTLLDMLALLRVHYAGRKVHLTAKAAISQRAQAYFEALGYKLVRSMGLLGYRLDALKEPMPVGQPRLAEHKDVDTLCGFQYGFHRDCFGQELPADPREGLVSNIGKGQVWVLEMDGRIACMVQVSLNETTHALVVNQVYTHPDFRGRGCAKHLVATAIRPFIDQGLHAVLYADSKNPFSNAAYRHVGFVLQGELLEIEMTQEERNP